MTITTSALPKKINYKNVSNDFKISKKSSTVNYLTIGYKILVSNSTKPDNRTNEKILTGNTNTTRAVNSLDKLPNRTANNSKTNNVTVKPGNVSLTTDNTRAEKSSNGSTSDMKRNVTLYVTSADLTKGRLGNQMFTYASLLGIARAQNRRFVVSPGSDLQNTFKLLHVAQMQDSGGWQVVREKHAYAFDTRLLNLTKENISIGGYLQSYKYFKDYADEVRQEFLFSDSIANEAYLIVHNLISERKGNLFVGVHIRRGDFLNGGNPKLGYGVPEKSYFLKAFKWMQSKFPNRNITYLVASDDLNWCNDNLKSDNVLALPNAPPAIHMAILSSCDHVIMSGGTYGWWSSFLAGGYVVYFKGFMSKGTTFGDSFNPETYYPPLWVGMEN
ncbi:unnamed protein product [Candidula unifasciata]|uniref:L-Fucosyltransferase n=1 Tax=Candidula unifasciata TaxID=100452 RepID=A0A8S3ZLB3_9EUPU|nr:unnamed protein product [Candidula unifasciata]